MPTADYTCKECGYVVEHEASPLPAILDEEHTTGKEKCENSMLTRVWSFRIGRGTSGHTPPR